MSFVRYISSSLRITWQDYCVIWPQIILFQVYARLIQFGVFSVFSLFFFNYIARPSDILNSSLNFEILTIIKPAEITTFLFIFSIIGVVTFFYEYLGLVYITDQFYAGNKISITKTLRGIIQTIPRFIRILFLELSVCIGIILFTSLVGISLWTVLPEPLSFLFIVPFVILFMGILWNSILKFSYANLRIFENFKSLFHIFDKTLSKQQLLRLWISSCLFIGLTLGLLYCGSLLSNWILNQLSMWTTSLLTLSYLSSVVIIVAGFNSVLFIGFLIGFVVLYYNREFHHEFSKIHAFPQDQHDYPYEIKLQKFWRNYRVYISFLLVIFTSLFIHLQAVQLNANLERYLDTDFVTMAHRGGSGAAENTREAIINSINNGIDMIEIDIQITSDNVPILYHDKTLKKAGLDRVVSSTPYSTISTLQYPTGEYIPTLKEILQITQNTIGLNLELKLYSEIQSELVQSIARDLNGYKTSKDIIISSLSYEALELWSETTDNYETGLIIAANIGDLGGYDVDWFIVNNLFYRTARADFLESGKKIALWSFSQNWDGVEAFEAGLDAGISDQPASLSKMVTEFNDLETGERTTQSLLWVIESY